MANVRGMKSQYIGGSYHSQASVDSDECINQIAALVSRVTMNQMEMANAYGEPFAENLPHLVNNQARMGNDISTGVNNQVVLDKKLKKINDNVFQACKNQVVISKQLTELITAVNNLTLAIQGQQNLPEDNSEPE